MKVRLCLRRTGEFSNWIDAVKRIYRFEGARAFWRGYVLNQIGIVPYAGFDLACYEVTSLISTDSSLTDLVFLRICRVSNVFI